MDRNTIVLTVTLVVMLALLVGGIFLQIFLSKKENCLLGLILPGITFLFGLLSVFNVAVMPGMTGWDVFRAVAAVFVTANIPTIVLLGIYFACRETRRRKKQLEKMSIQDLD